MPRVIIERPFPFRGTTLTPGAVVDLPRGTVRTVLAGRPPFGRLADKGDSAELEPDPPPPEDASSEGADEGAAVDE